MLAGAKSREKKDKIVDLKSDRAEISETRVEKPGLALPQIETIIDSLARQGTRCALPTRFQATPDVGAR
jgi:hypothetical protein